MAPEVTPRGFFIFAGSWHLSREIVYDMIVSALYLSKLLEKKGSYQHADRLLTCLAALEDPQSYLNRWSSVDLDTLDKIIQKRSRRELLTDNPERVRLSFAVLNLSWPTTPEEVKQNFRQISKLLHPDINSDPRAEHMFKLLRFAYENMTEILDNVELYQNVLQSVTDVPLMPDEGKAPPGTDVVVAPPPGQERPEQGATEDEIPNTEGIEPDQAYEDGEEGPSFDDILHSYQQFSSRFFSQPSA